MDEALLLLEADAARGLAGTEAAARLARHGDNVLPRFERRPAVLRLLLQLRDPLVITLLVAAAVTFAVGETVDGTVILAVVVVNALVGFVQESRAERALDALMLMVRATALVLRDGLPTVVPTPSLVPGDVVLLRTGDEVGADLRLLTVQNLQIDESALTGESVPMPKHALALPATTVLADRANMAFAGTLVTAGTGTAVVVATGSATELGRVHRLLGETKLVATPLTAQLGRFARLLTWAIVALGGVAFAVGLARGDDPADVLVAAVALAVGAIPEGLPAAVTIALAIGVTRMARRNAVVRRLPAVETLGSTTVICTDKTGTLTENAMTVQELWTADQTFTFTGTGYAPTGDLRLDGAAIEPGTSPALRRALRAAALCGDGDAVLREGRWVAVGDPMESALVVAARKAGLAPADELRAAPRTGVLPFDSERRFMATTHGGTDGERLLLKGAVEQVLERCDRVVGPDGSALELDRAAVLRRAEALGRTGMRVLALAERHAAPGMLTDPRGACLLGLVALVDPPRPAAAEAVRACREAGIAVKMITGDHPSTAGAIAARVGLVARGARLEVLTGTELATVPPAELDDAANRVAVFARVSAEQKLLLIRALQRRGHIVAMTGDGVNDAPALRQADIGVAMGRGGTEVARQAADVVLTDDDFSSIRAAVEEGRHTFDNLRKFLVWTLPTNIAEGLVILTAVVVGSTLPVLPVQVLWVNMATAVLLGLPLAVERIEPGILRRPPRPPGAPLLERDLVGRMILVGLVLVAGVFWVFDAEQARGATVPEARTAAVAALVAAQAAFLLSCRTLRGPVRAIGLLSNRWLLGGVAAMAVLQAAFTVVPFMNDAFHTAPPDAAAWPRIAALALGTWAVAELHKRVTRRNPA